MASLYLGPWAGAPWDVSRWPNFSPHELACPCCGEILVREDALDAIQRLRDAMAAPLIIDSGHRCALHNARVGGAPLSQHKSLAFDVRLSGHAPMVLRACAQQCGFHGFGYGNSFLHLDVRARPAHWFYGKRSIEKWTSLGL
jgi:hypothetical protein